MMHIIFTYKGKLCQCYKNWDIDRIESVLSRLGATYWEIGFDESELSKALNNFSN